MPTPRAVEQKLADVFECAASVFLVSTGTTANALSLATLVQPWQNVLCHSASHINNDECGAPEFFTGGARLITLGGEQSKINAQELEAAVWRKRGDVHTTQPGAVSLTQATESGSVYSVDEITALGSIAKAAGLPLHMDGARFANALVTLGCTPAEMTWKAGVNALSFGATKNGALGVEAIVLFDPVYAQELAYRRKRGGHLFSKMRLLSAQMNAYLTDDLWLRNARHANAMAQRLEAGLRQVAGIVLPQTTQANILFCSVPVAMAAGLQAAGFGFLQGRWAPGVIRLVTSFATRAEDVDAFIAAAQKLAV